MMNRPANCPKCDGRMSTGFILDIGHGGAVTVSKWQEGAPQKSFWTGIKQRKEQQQEIATWRCERCGFLESYAV
ncbi:MAG: hypothetical protein JWO81_3092 [Alphaproteobacteria bacterium]|nr:hypothetical protein [Alphaproteobacteria bacterium]